jgi:hypothetical protein
MISEWSIVSLFVLMPLIYGGASWFTSELNKSKCAYQSFEGARRQMILTGSEVSFPVQIGKMNESISLAPLEDLDQGMMGLNPSDLGGEVSRLSGDVSHFLRRLQGLRSTTSSTASKI